MILPSPAWLTPRNKTPVASPIACNSVMKDNSLSGGTTKSSMAATGQSAADASVKALRAFQTFSASAMKISTARETGRFIEIHTVLVKAVFTLTVELDDHIGTTVRAVLFFIEPCPDDFDDIVIHKFQTRRRNAGLGKGRYQCQSLFSRWKDGQDVCRRFRQGHEL